MLYYVPKVTHCTGAPSWSKSYNMTGFTWHFKLFMSTNVNNCKRNNQIFFKLFFIKNPVSERILYYLSAKNIDPLVFMKTLGYGSQGNYNRISAGKWEPSNIMLKKIKKAYPDINLKWVQTGEGAMEVGSNINIANEEQVLYGVSYVEVDEKKEIARLMGENIRLKDEVAYLRKALEMALQNQSKR